MYYSKLFYSIAENHISLDIFWEDFLTIKMSNFQNFAILFIIAGSLILIASISLKCTKEFPILSIV